LNVGAANVVTAFSKSNGAPDAEIVVNSVIQY